VERRAPTLAWPSPGCRGGRPAPVVVALPRNPSQANINERTMTTAVRVQRAAERLVAALVVAILAAPALAADGLPEETLAECVAIALDNHPSLKAADASIEAGHQRVRQAASSYLPTIAGLYTFDRRNTNTAARLGIPVANPTPNATPGVTLQGTGSSQTFNFSQASINFTQLLFDFGQTLNSIRANQALEQSLQAQRSTQADAVVFNVKQAYFNVLATRRLLGVADETVRQNQKHLDQAQGRFDVGVAAKFDVTQAQVQLANAELNQVTARNNVAVAHETLRNALGLTGPLDFDIVDDLDVHTVQITQGADIGHGEKLFAEPVGQRHVCVDR